MAMLAVFAAVAFGSPEVPQFDLTCTLSPSESKMSVRYAIDLPQSELKGDRLTFSLGDAMSLPAVTLDQGDGPKPLECRQDSSSGHEVMYSFPVTSGKAARLEFTYASVAGQGSVYYLSPRECFCGGYNTLWFPSVTEERRRLGTMTFKTPSDFLVKASGKELSTEVSGSTRTTRFKLEQPIVPTFASAPFTVVHIPGKVPVSMYMLKPRATTAEFGKGVAEVMGVLQRPFGPYPYPDFSIIETPSPISSQLGFTGASFEGFMFGDTNNIEGGFNIAYFGHEMSHQWWGNLVSATGDKGVYPMSEGLAQFGSLQVVKELGGVALAKTYRTTGYPRYSGWQALAGALAFEAAGYDEPLAFNPPKDGILAHQRANSKGFLAWETVSQIVGQRSFLAGLRSILRKHAWGTFTWKELWVALEAASHRDLTLLRKQWFESKGIPSVWTEWSQDKLSLRVTLCQSKPEFWLRMPLVITYKDGKSQTRWIELDRPLAPLEIPVRGSVQSVELDPDFITLHSTPALDAKAAVLKDYALVDYFYPLLGRQSDSAALVEEAVRHLPSPDPFGAEFLLRLTYGGNLRREGKLAEAKKQLLAALQCPVRDTSQMPLAYLRLALVANAEKADFEVRKYLAAMKTAEAVLPYPTGVIDSAKSLLPEFFKG